MVKNLSNWMGELDPTVRLWDLLIPGTHDTMTGSCGEKYYKTQNLSLEEQLAIGVRFLDLRLTRNMEAAHREWMSGIKGKEILNIIKTFLKENPNETIVVRFQNANEKKDDYEAYGEALQKLVQDNLELFHLWPKNWQWPSLGECKGKIVALECSPPSYRFNCLNDRQWAVNWHENPKINLQDAWDGPELAIKQQSIKDNLIESKSLPTVLSLNHISATNGVLAYPDEYANKLNPFLYTHLDEIAGKGYNGVLIMDFIESKDAEKIINYNFSPNS